MKEKTGDEELPFFFNRRKDFGRKTAEHWQGIVFRINQEAKSDAEQVRLQDSARLSNNDSNYE